MHELGGMQRESSIQTNTKSVCLSLFS